MNFNIDIAIFAVFLAVNLAVGVAYSRGIYNLREYAIGNRSFSTGAIAATIAATWIGGGVLSQTIAETYKHGLYFIIPALGDSLVLLVVGYFLAPRMAEFLEDLSIAESMDRLYGRTIRLVTALVAIISCIGAVAAQFKVSAVILQLLFDVSGFYAVVAAAIIVVLYSSFGGIKAVTFTDIIQIFTFAVAIPIVSLIIWGTLDDSERVLERLVSNQNFDYTQVFNVHNPRFLDSVLLFLFFIIPTLEPAIFQRINMAKNTIQGRRSFILASFICLLISLVIAWIGVLLWAKNPNLNPNNLLAHIINDYSYPGLKGIIAVGVMAIVMSTADSYINSAAVLVANDVFPFKVNNKDNSNSLILPRVTSVIVAAISFSLAFNTQSLLELTFLIWGSYMPIITVPLILAILGFRSTPRAVLTGMLAGLSTMIAFKFLDVKIKAVIPAMCANGAFLFISHYLLGESGGWVGVKIPEPLFVIRLERARKIQNFVKGVREFSLWNFCKNNTPRQDYVYSLFGLFCIISVFSTMYSIPKEIQLEQHKVLEFVYHTVLISSSILLTFPIWPPTFKQEKFIIVAWNIMLPYVLVFAPILLIIVSNFGQFQLMIFMVNMIVLALLLRWQVAVLTVCVAAFLSVEFYKWYIGVEAINAAVGVGLQFKIMYVLLLVSSILIIFLKPKQEYVEATEHKAEALEGENVKLTSEVMGLGTQVTDLNGQVIGLNNQVTTLNTKVEDLNEQVSHYTTRIADHEKEIDRLGQTSQRILNNVNHELRLPIGNVVNFADMLHETLQKTEDNELLKKMAEEVHKNSYRVSSMILNMLDFATLAVKKVDLDKSTVNLSELVKDRVNQCRKIYQKDKPIDFKLDIEPEIMISVDPNYMRQTVDNLVINAINFSDKGVIAITVKKEAGEVVFTIRDQGKGIPKNELFDIFTPFKMGSNTESKASGRGIGLALCKSAVEAHGGSILANSDGVCGAKLQFTLPRTTALH